MSNYFYAENNQQVGPVSMDELKTKNITRDTMVWKEGMENWEKAGDVAELSNIFAAIPPPLPKQETPVPPPPIQPSTPPPPPHSAPPPPPPRGQQMGSGNMNSNFSQNQNPADVLGTGMKVLCFIIPIVGLIVYLMNKNTLPNKSQSAGKMALYGFLLGMLINILLI